MKHIGRTVLLIAAGPGKVRNGESAFIRLRDGRILLAYTEFCGEHYYDDSTARLCACTSADEGETWSEPFVLLEKDEKAQNIMSPSLVRMNNGDLGMFYDRKEALPGIGMTCVPQFCRSADEGKTWSEPTGCGLPPGYYCGVNDCALRLKSGRILYPVSAHRMILDSGEVTGSSVRFAYSDDDGAAWAMLPAKLEGGYGLAEPGVYEHEDGTLWCWYRTACGFQYHSHSADGGLTWDPTEPNLCFTSPDAPMRVRRVGPYAAAVFNPLAFNCLLENTEIWGSAKRTPIVCAVSTDDGHSFADRGIVTNDGGMLDFARHCFLLETDRRESYCYPAIQETADGFLVSYYYSNGAPFALTSSKVVKVRREELE